MDHSTKEAHVAEFLREGIISGRFPRGSRLKQTEIASILNTSSTPVREALKLLEAEGYVQASSHRGCTVAPFELRTSDEVVTLRILLETQLVKGAVEKVTPTVLGELKGSLGDYSLAIAAGDKEASRTLNYRFHWCLYELADMPLMAHFVQILWARYPFDMQQLAGGRIEKSLTEHRMVLEAIASNDVAGAMFSMRQHIELGWQDLRTFLGSGRAGTPATAKAQGARHPRQGPADPGPGY